MLTRRSRRPLTEFRKRRRRHEDVLQKAVVSFLRLALPEGAVLFHIPNGGPQTDFQRMRLALMGVLPGMPDLGLVWRGKPIFIELKAPKGVVSDTQYEVHTALILAGAVVFVARSVDEVAAFLDQIMPLRGRVL